MVDNFVKGLLHIPRKVTHLRECIASLKMCLMSVHL